MTAQNEFLNQVERFSLLHRKESEKTLFEITAQYIGLETFVLR